MESVLRAAAVYFLLLLIFRIAGKRSLSQVTTFDLILTLIISEAIQEALIGEDRSMTNALVLVLTLIGLDVFLSWAKFKWQSVAKFLEGTPVVVMRNGQTILENMKAERVDESDITEAARGSRGVAALQSVKHAVVERDGSITIVPTAEARRSVGP